MGESKPAPSGNEKKGLNEKAARLYRNWNALGALALGGLAMVAPVGNVVLAGLAGLNAAQAGAGEVWLRAAEKARKKRSKKK